MKPSKIYERSFSWPWKTLKDLRGWIKRRPLLGVVVHRASPACTCAFAQHLTLQRPRRRSGRSRSQRPGSPSGASARDSPRLGLGRSQVAFLHFPPRIINWLMCTLITFQEDSFYLCCASVGKALNKYFTYFIMTMNGINHSTGIVLQLMFTF